VSGMSWGAGADVSRNLGTWCNLPDSVPHLQSGEAEGVDVVDIEINYSTIGMESG